MNPQPVSLPSALPARPHRRSAGRYFYTIAAAAIITIVVIGFSRTYYLRPVFTSEALSRLLHVHGLIMSLWLGLFLVQSTLVATRNVQIHRKLGWAAAAVGVSVLVVGTVVAIATARAGRAPPPVPPLVFLAIPLFDMLGFAALIGLGIYWRNRTEWHKRLLLLGTLSILPAAIARFPFDWIQRAGPLAYFGLTDLCVGICALVDWRLRGRLHPVFAWGGIAIAGLQAFQLWFSGTAVWHAFATWLVS